MADAILASGGELEALHSEPPNNNIPYLDFTSCIQNTHTTRLVPVQTSRAPPSTVRPRCKYMISSIVEYCAQLFNCCISRSTYHDVAPASSDSGRIALHHLVTLQRRRHSR